MLMIQASHVADESLFPFPGGLILQYFHGETIDVGALAAINIVLSDGRLHLQEADRDVLCVSPSPRLRRKLLCRVDRLLHPRCTGLAGVICHLGLGRSSA